MEDVTGWALAQLIRSSVSGPHATAARAMWNNDLKEGAGAPSRVPNGKRLTLTSYRGHAGCM
jgi:hypothetical protein